MQKDQSVDLTAPQPSNFSQDMTSFLSEATQQLAESLDYEETLKKMGALIVPRLADWFTIEVPNNRTGCIDLLTVHHFNPEKIKWALELRKTSPPRLDDTSGSAQVLKTGKALYIKKVTEEMIQAAVKKPEDLKLLQEIGFCSVMIMPLRARGKTLGVISFITTTESNYQYTRQDFQLTSEFAQRAAVALDNSLLYRKVQTELAGRTKAEQRLQMAQQAAQIGTFEWDMETDQMYWSSEFKKLYGVRDNPNFKPSAKAWIALIHPDDVARVNEQRDQQMQTGDTIELEFRIIKNETDVRWMYSKYRYIRNSQGEPIRAIGINMDITERKRLEQQKDEFLSIASHELKTPITSIKAFVQILHKYFKPDDVSSAKYLTHMDSQVDKLTKLVQDLLDVSKIQTGKLEYAEDVFLFDDLITQVIEEMQPLTAQHQIEFHSGAAIRMIADKYRLSQVITNLISNAIKYSPTADKIIVASSFKDAMVTVSVQDFGIGIPKEKHDQLFKRFYRVVDKQRESYPGLGLGLYISSEIIKRERGSIWFTSEENAGSTFYISLPITLFADQRHTQQLRA
jgi:PAS domain S-box-containing protein